MAKMIKKSGNFFNVTDTITSDVEINYSASLINYSPINDNAVRFSIGVSGKTIGQNTYLFSDIVDENSIPFASYQALTSWLDDNVGFNPASGGSEAFDIKKYLGVVDYNDLNTFTNPIQITGNLLPVYLTNDGLGVATNKLYKPNGVGETWNVNTQQFDFSDLPLGSTVFYRLDIEIATMNNNQEVFIDIELGIGGASYILNIDHEEYKSIGLYPITVSNLVYIGDANTKDNGAKLSVRSDGSCFVRVNGWALSYNLLSS